MGRGRSRGRCSVLAARCFYVGVHHGGARRSDRRGCGSVPLAMVLPAWRGSSGPAPRGLAAGASGALVGAICFLPAFVFWSGTSSTVLALAAVAGAMAGGAASANVVLRVSPAKPSSGSFAAGVIVILAVFAAALGIFWQAVLDRMPVWELSREAVVNLPAGDASGTQWSGCYSYEGTSIPNTYGAGLPRRPTGRSGGMVIVTQNGGALQMDFSDRMYLGGVNQNGDFWAGYDSEGVRMRIDGQFMEHGFTYQKRGTALRQGTPFNTIVDRGLGRPCR